MRSRRTLAIIALVVVFAAACGGDAEPETRAVDLARTTGLVGTCDVELANDDDPFRSAIDAAVFATPDSDDRLVEDLLSTAPEVASVTRVGRDEVFAEFERVIADLADDRVADTISASPEDMPVRFEVVAAPQGPGQGFRTFIATAAALPGVQVVEAIDGCLPGHLGDLVRCNFDADAADAQANVMAFFIPGAVSVLESIAPELGQAGGVDTLRAVAADEILNHVSSQLDQPVFELQLDAGDAPTTFLIVSSDPSGTVDGIRDLADGESRFADLFVSAGVIGDDCS